MPKKLATRGSMGRVGVSVSRLGHNPRRQKKTKEKQFGSKEFKAWIHTLPCFTCPSQGPVHQSHIRSRGAGGTWEDSIPQCPRCHDLLHKGIETFCSKHAIPPITVEDLKALPACVQKLWNTYCSRRTDGIRCQKEERDA